MKAMILNQISDMNINPQPLVPAELPDPVPSAGEILVKIHTCAVCHTELDEIEGRTPPPQYPVVPGHQIVGRVAALGPEVSSFKEGDRVGIAWIFSACGNCEHCRTGNENLCAEFRATGRDVNGGYAEYLTVDEKFAYPIPKKLNDYEAAPLLCAGAIGYRSLQLTNIRDGQRLGLTGFGASGHLVLKMVREEYPNSSVYVFARNPEERDFARELGALWAGDTDDRPPQLLHSIIDTTPVWKPVLSAMKCLRPGGRLVINAIRKENTDIDQWRKLDYGRDLWMEKEIKSVANVTRRDVSEFLQLAASIPLKPDYEKYDLERANTALSELKKGQIRGAKVLRIK